MVRVSEIHANGRAAKTYLAAPGRPDLDLLPHEVVRCAFLVDYRRHSHDAFLLLQPFLLRGSQLSRANSLAHAELSSFDMLPVYVLGLGLVAVEHEGRRRHRGATTPSAAVSKRRCTPFCPKLLRSPGWPGRSRCYRCTGGHGAHRAHR